MNSGEYAKRYGLRPGRLRDCLKKGRVRGARRVEGDWFIPEDAMIAYYVRPKKERTVQDVVWDIVRAVHLSQYFDDEVLQVSANQFSTALDISMHLGYVKRAATPNDGVTSSGYAITPEGMLACEKNKRDFISDLVKLIGSTAGAAAGSFYSAAL